MSVRSRIRENWRISLLVVLLALSAFFLFVPGAPFGDSIGEEPEQEGGTSAWTNIQYGIELSGGARVRAPVTGITAEETDQFTDTAEVTEDVRMSLNEEGDYELRDRDIRADPDERTVEVFNGNVTEDEFEQALEDADVLAPETSIRDGVTDATRASIVEVLNERMGQAGFDGGTVRQAESVGGPTYIVIESPGQDLDDLRQLITEQNVVEVIAHYPADNEDGYDEQLALEQEDISNIGTVSYNDAREQYELDVVISDDAAEGYVQILDETGIINEGVENCQYVEGGEPPYGYCQMINLDDETISGLGMNQGLADQMVASDWVDDRGFVITTPDSESAEEIRVSLESGTMPAELDVDAGDQNLISSERADQFRTNGVLAGLMAIATVVLMVFLRYGDPRVAAPMSITALSEVVILLGFAAAIKWPLDLATVAGFIAVVGTGVDDLIIIADEVMSEGDVSSRRVFDSRFSKAFWIIGAAAATTIIAMSPLAVLSLGDLTGFAIFTILGVLVGVFITRPAYGNILRNIKTER